jgi:hypothetical protein
MSQCLITYRCTLYEIHLLIAHVMTLMTDVVLVSYRRKTKGCPVLHRSKGLVSSIQPFSSEKLDSLFLLPWAGRINLFQAGFGRLIRRDKSL